MMRFTGPLLASAAFVLSMASPVLAQAPPAFTAAQVEAETGEPLWRFRTGVDPQTGVKEIDPAVLPGGVDHVITVCPYGGGGRNWMPTSHDVDRGAVDRRYTAYDAETGRQLWGVGLPEVPNGTPITYSMNGRQYVALIAGYGSPSTTTWPGLVPEITLPPVRSSAVFVFALPRAE